MNTKRAAKNGDIVLIDFVGKIDNEEFEGGSAKDFVVEIGNPFGIGQKVTSGIISALGRTGLGIEAYEHFIQTDESIKKTMEKVQL